MPKCPYCEKPIALKAKPADRSQEIRRQVTGTVKKEVMYSCPHCDRVLGFGFFMGGLFTGRP